VKLSEVISEARIRLDFKATDKREVLRALLDGLGGGYDADALLAGLLEREELGSTGLGRGVAVPHVRLDEAQDLAVVFGRPAKPVDFGAVDGAPCALFFLVIGPTRKESQEKYLQAMAKISRMMRDAAAREKLLAAKSAAEVVGALAAKEA
jgi:mannitol/fructose-specific phosphotransferase system IIA component (Ntr-type)